ncbi:hypothetical protein ASZ90_007245 [hydrocarbon metagenome]|uniref:DUF6922 domain-containing protein n=1 Tax=hydrocarbon metagenome TaxID=938273 RepID=A0A0W8FPY9_9ZZZZ
METLEKQELFWDVNLAQLDKNAHKRFIVKRILQFGDLDDLRWALTFYGYDGVRSIFLSSADQFDNKSRNFWRFYFHVHDGEECIKKQSMSEQNAFGKR